MNSRTLLVLLVSLLAYPAAAQDTLNLYSARHYQTDEALYDNFTKATGIRIQRIEGREDELIERIKNEGASSPADVFITVDAARLAQADALGLFAPIRSKLIEARVPAHLRSTNWVAFSTRARVIIYNKVTVTPDQVRTYESLAEPGMKGKVCSRSGSHPYNLSLGAALIAHWGEAKTEDWARRLVANFARPPKGGDTDQIKAVAAGECQVAISNTYYLVRLMRSNKPEDRQTMEKVGVVWPNQASFGTHINVSGGGILKTAPHKDAAVRFLEYLSSDEAQVHFANGNNEWPVVRTAIIKNPELASLGQFKADTLNIGQLAQHVATAQKVFDRAGFR
ncbi:MAG: iron ABC transporter substrate-binding protein [Betaproteobacteria bacterium]